MRVRPKSAKEIRSQCKTQGVPFKTYTAETVMVGDVRYGFAIYNPLRGTFIGRTPTGVGFNSVTASGDARGFMRALRRFFHHTEE